MRTVPGQTRSSRGFSAGGDPQDQHWANPTHTACSARAAAAVVLLGTAQGSRSGVRSESLAPCALGRLPPLLSLLYGASPSQELCCPLSKEQCRQKAEPFLLRALVLRLPPRDKSVLSALGAVIIGAPSSSGEGRVWLPGVPPESLN